MSTKSSSTDATEMTMQRNLYLMKSNNNPIFFYFILFPTIIYICISKNNLPTTPKWNLIFFFSLHSLFNVSILISFFMNRILFLFSFNNMNLCSHFFRGAGDFPTTKWSTWNDTRKLIFCVCCHTRIEGIEWEKMNHDDWIVKRDN